jgi:hypothetical protein
MGPPVVAHLKYGRFLLIKRSRCLAVKDRRELLVGCDESTLRSFALRDGSLKKKRNDHAPLTR